MARGGAATRPTPIMRQNTTQVGNEFRPTRIVRGAPRVGSGCFLRARAVPGGWVCLPAVLTAGGRWAMDASVQAGMHAMRQLPHTIHSGTGTPPGAVDHSGRHEFFRVQIPLGPAGRIPPGQYQFPFLFVLPTNLPASFYCSSGNKRWVGLRRTAGQGVALDLAARSAAPCHCLQRCPPHCTLAACLVWAGMLP